MLLAKTLKIVIFHRENAHFQEIEHQKKNIEQKSMKNRMFFEPRFWEDFGRVLGGFGKNLRAFWVILGLCGLFWAVGVFWADLRKILVGAPCCNGIHFELKL